MAPSPVEPQPGGRPFPWGPTQVLIGGFIALFLFLMSSLVSILFIVENLGSDVATSDVGDIFDEAVAIGEYADERLKAAAEGVSLPDPPEMLADVEALKIAVGATMVYEALVLAMVGGVTRQSFGGLVRALGMNRYDWRGIWRPVALYFAAYAGVLGYTIAVQQFGIELLIPQSTVPDAVTRDDALLAMMVIVAVVGAPVSEEFLFRGLIFGGLSKWGFWPAAAISSLVFAAVHFDLGSLFPFFLVGMVMCWLFWRERNLWDALIFHVLFNATSAAALIASR